MDSFHAMFWDNKVFINKKHQYLNNEILVSYLNLDSDELEETYNDLRHAARAVLINLDADAGAYVHYTDRVKIVQKILTKLDAIYLSLPPYYACKDSRKDYGEQLYKCLNRYTILFDDGVEEDEYRSGYIFPDHNEYGYSTCDEKGNDIFWLVRFELSKTFDLWKNGYDKEDTREDVDALNADIQHTITPYLRWLEGVLRVRFVYAKLIDEFLHIRHAFLREHEVAEQLEKYLLTEKPANKIYMRIGSAEPQAVSHEVFRPGDNKPILCDSYDFDSIGAFLYTDFFRGLANNHIPKKCQNCGKWFLLPFGKYSDYCENPLPDDSAKTCRDVSARKKYDDKCRTDPVWLAYNRAYKAHYARYMKKKMTNAEFEKWGVYAIELRTQALEGALEFAEYERLLKV